MLLSDMDKAPRDMMVMDILDMSVLDNSTALQQNTHMVVVGE